jgi:hypothetical protein
MRTRCGGGSECAAERCTGRGRPAWAAQPYRGLPQGRLEHGACSSAADVAKQKWGDGEARGAARSMGNAVCKVAVAILPDPPVHPGHTRQGRASSMRGRKVKTKRGLTE